MLPHHARVLMSAPLDLRPGNCTLETPIKRFQKLAWTLILKFDCCLIKRIRSQMNFLSGIRIAKSIFARVRLSIENKSMPHYNVHVSHSIFFPLLPLYLPMRAMQNCLLEVYLIHQVPASLCITLCGTKPDLKNVKTILWSEKRAR
jgi:hypothetical protein